MVIETAGTLDKRLSATLIFFALMLTLCLDSSCAQEMQSNRVRPQIFVHYMPWYQSKDVSGQWGWHWTMNHFDPERINGAGKREIASHDYPLIGPYDSNDPDALECQVLLMKFSGVDGAIVDWYGVEPFRDYAILHRNTLHFIEYIKKAKLSFAICYEDQTVKHMLSERHFAPSKAIAQGRAALQWLDQNWFDDPSYLQIDGKPAMLVFGPQYFQKREWALLRSELKTAPTLFGLPHLDRQNDFEGAFGWPPVNGGTVIPVEKWKQYLNELYSRPNARRSVIAVAFPGFKDIYAEANVSETHGSIDERNGKTFKETLDLAINSDSQFIQIATWNDYGEGTVIEPTMRSGFRYLTDLQQRIKRCKFSAEDLELPVSLYQLRKQYAGDDEKTVALETISNLLFSGDCDAAREKLTLLKRDSN